MSAVAAALFAHAGAFSWDEMLFLVMPVVILGGLLLAAKRKAPARSTGDGPTPKEGLGSGAMIDRRPAERLACAPELAPDADVPRDS